jgi:type IV secretion system protein VirB1
MMSCQNLAVPAEVMQHVVNVESSRNPYAIGVVGGQLVRQPENLREAVATVRALEEKGYNYSLGAAQVNRANLGKFGLDTFEKAFEYCPNLVAGSRILAQCYSSAGGDWGKAFSCYYSGNFTTGYQDGYVQKIYDSMARSAAFAGAEAIPLIAPKTRQVRVVSSAKGTSTVEKDDPAYRVAIRSVVDAAAAAAIGPAVASATGQASSLPQMQPDPRFVMNPGISNTTPPSQTDLPPGRIQTDQTTAAMMDQIGASVRDAPRTANGVNNGRIPTDPATAAVMSQVGVSSASPLGNAAAPLRSGEDIFVPQVHGPNDSSVTPAPSSQTPARPAGDAADLRAGARDDAFVF